MSGALIEQAIVIGLDDARARTYSKDLEGVCFEALSGRACSLLR